MGRILIASHRLPVTLREEQGQPRIVPSAGGLATAMRSVHADAEALWVGHVGDMSALSLAARAGVEGDLASMRLATVPMTQAEVSHHYDGFSNGVLWPLFHYLVDKVRLDAERDWHVYKQVNQRFAEVIAREHRTGDVVWIHDYQLALVPDMLRQIVPDATIGFFLHVPFPAADLFRILPWREPVLRGMLGADLIGFHTSGYRHNFAHAAAVVLGLEMDVDVLSVNDRAVHLGVHPIGIDAEAFERAARSPEATAEVERLRAETGNRRIVLGIDRLDYTKGIPRKLLSIDRLLQTEPSLRDKLHFIQIAVPTREKVDAYSELRQNVNQLVGKLNAQHGSPTRAPIQLLYRSIPFAQMIALYRAADVMLVTPLRDGMNLVAKEYVAARVDERGALVLSELAGASDELREAFLVNPYDISGVANAVTRALKMPAAEQQARMRAMRARVRAGDANRWATRFVEALRGASKPSRATREARSIGALIVAMQEAARAPARLVLLDYDGTLAPIEALPDLAAPADATLELLRRLAETPDTSVHVITGRTRESIERWLGALPIGLHAEHGFWTRAAGEWAPIQALPTSWMSRVEPVFRDFVDRTPGSFIEPKTASLALHYRGSDPTLAQDRLRTLRPQLVRIAAEEPVEILEGAKIMEVRIAGIHKGVVASRLMRESPPGTQVIAAGDDRTDEDMFAALPEEALSIRVGRGQSMAAYRVESPAELRSVLQLLAREAG